MNELFPEEWIKKAVSLSRFRILSYNELQYPHKCGTCGSFSGDNGKRYVDFGCWVEYYGTVYICTECFLGATTELNVVPMSRFKSIEQNNAELQVVVQTLISENRALRDGIDHIRSSITSRPNPDTNNDNVVPSSESERRSTEPGLEPKDSSTVSSGHDNTASERKDEPVGQNDGGGHQNIRNDDESIGLNIFDI